MSISLKKGERISLNKLSSKPLSCVQMGLGWVGLEKKGFFKRLFGGGNIDLDASCVLVNTDNYIENYVYYGHLQTLSGAVRHSGDDLVGKSSGTETNLHVPNEIITVELARIPPAINYLIFTVTSYRGQSFCDIDHAFCTLSSETGEELCYYDISDCKTKNTALVMAKLYRHNNEWKFASIGTFVDGRTVQDLQGIICQFI